MSREQDDYLPLLTPGSQLDLGKGDPVDRSKHHLSSPTQLIMTDTGWKIVRVGLARVYASIPHHLSKTANLGVDRYDPIS